MRHDGCAELCGYRWHGTRYGQERSGEAVAIFVTEPFSEARHVKVDKPDEDPGDVVPAMKLNLIRDFQTGIYDYNTMVSCFVRASDFSPMKLTYSSAEWCGHLYEELDLGVSATRLSTRSYFEGQSGERSLASKSDGLVGEQLFIWLRGLRGAPLAAGETKTWAFLAPRLLHHSSTSRTNSLGVENSVPSPELSSRKVRSSSVRARLKNLAKTHLLAVTNQDLHA